MLCALLLWQADPVRAEALAPACRAEVRLEPERAFVGEQVIYRLHILRRPEVVAVRWEQPLAFPSFRSEWLPGRRPDPDIGDIGSGALVYEERRALFPARAGRLEVPEARLRCSVGQGDALRTVTVAVPALTLEVKALPERGRPESFAGLVGPLQLDAAVLPGEIALGESTRLSIRVHGTGNVWSAAEPLDVEATLPGVDVLPQPPQVDVDAGERVVAHKSFRYDLVPRRTGRLVIPALHLDYFDPIERRFARAETRPIAIAVGPARATPAPDVEPPPTEAAPELPPHSASTRGRIWLAVLALGLAAVAAVAWRRFSGRSDPVEIHLLEAERAEASGDSEAARRALDRALRTALARFVPQARDASPERIVGTAPAPARAAALALEALEQARFGGGGTAPDVAAVRAALERR